MALYSIIFGSSALAQQGSLQMESSIRRRPLRTRNPSRKFLENAATCSQEEEEERLHSVAKEGRLEARQVKEASHKK